MYMREFEFLTSQAGLDKKTHQIGCPKDRLWDHRDVPCHCNGLSSRDKLGRFIKIKTHKDNLDVTEESFEDKIGADEENPREYV